MWKYFVGIMATDRDVPSVAGMFDRINGFMNSFGFHEKLCAEFPVRVAIIESNMQLTPEQMAKVNTTICVELTKLNARQGSNYSATYPKLMPFTDHSDEPDTESTENGLCQPLPEVRPADTN